MRSRMAFRQGARIMHAWTSDCQDLGGRIVKRAAKRFEKRQWQREEW